MGKSKNLDSSQLEDILEALSLNQARALELMASTGFEVFGHSFDSKGKILNQFLVLKVFGDSALITYFSWLDGRQTNSEKVPLSWIKNECALYLDEEQWRLTADRSVAHDIKSTKRKDSGR